MPSWTSSNNPVRTIRVILFSFSFYFLFFLEDDTHYWWNDMPEPKHFVIVPNAEHSLITGIFVALPSISAFLSAHLHKTAVPSFTWSIDKSTGEIVATVHDGAVHSAQVWWATSCGVNDWDNGINRRDYRVAHMDQPCSCGFSVEGYCANLKSAWNKKTLEATMVKGKRTYSAKLDAPEDGRWVAFMIDFKFKNPNLPSPTKDEGFNADDLNKIWTSHPDTPAGKIAYEYSRYFENFGGFPHDFAHFFEFTTEVSVWPDTFPYEDCVGAACGDAPLV
jgi:hypothetical protein